MSASVRADQRMVMSFVQSQNRVPFLLLDFSVIKAAMGCMLAQMDDEEI